MKKFFKFGCLGLIGLVVLIIVLAVIGSDGGDEKTPVSSDTNSTSEDTNSTSTEEPTEEDNADEKSAAVNQDFKVNGLDIKISNIVITKKDVKIDMTLTNTTDNQISFYPDQGSMVIGNTQVDANLFMTKGDLSGDIHAGVEKTGTIRFMAPDDKEFTPNEIKEVKLVLGSVLDNKSFSSEEFQQTIAIE